ncbi:hypothetical protein FOA43_004704 [Brettanomyces nanus]|uniref:Uncharacterized protein n=1 Tax=Eeniella nana TaxID=13502 RepID=A0A875S7G4_EENNA|nr:uncharacterized protein FOA43_004704 [Brettanomyces nanus]QPG77296.1 hypothetical protein FOA43_004704 [Brettanomyces nanus]
MLVFSATMLFVVVGSLLEVSSSLVDDYLWRRSIINRSIPVYDIPPKDKYVQLYIETCTSTREYLNNQLNVCIDNGSKFQSSRYMAKCFVDYSEGLRKDAKFCDFNVEKMLVEAYFKYSKEYAHLLVYSASVVAAEYRRSFLNNTKVLSAQITGKVVSLYYDQFIPAYKEVLHSSSRLYNNYLITGYQKTLAESGHLYDEYVNGKVKPWSSNVYHSVKSLPVWEHIDKKFEDARLGGYRRGREVVVLFGNCRRYIEGQLGYLG